jgi:hypothetical protein
MTVYRPFILPRLQGWNRIPALIVIAFVLPFALIVIATGAMAKGQRLVVIHALGIGLVWQLLDVIGSSLGLPWVENSIHQ